ncbi:unnamed protein product [Rotaria magnacalcarata]|uniref:Uncharacterized protein n=3 Tax=Rotaria magnacalcarata TaxID=392030 RepID=A0A816U627_9BILA|nr:unnamed protein product [Rotaria magnacalcarata]CAF1655018.1 unnamed protein product [Rotaria magnacalcarata]CAF2103933.1 unnamed protein product [Rotaria magnacalcarata]CAF2148389.1 unnamed protein product [Rotaria magnacalcarata]
MIKTALPTGSFDQFLSSYEDDRASIEFNNEIHTILICIGLLTVILLIVLLIFSFVSKCMKLFNDETNSTTKINRYQSNFSINRQIKKSSISSSSSSSLLIGYQSNKTPLKPSLSATLRMLQYRQQHFPAIVHV